MLVRREPDLDDLSIPTLLLRLRAEQKESWLAGRPVDVTTYFREHPRIAADPEARFELIYHEVLVREELGERPDPAAYARAFPDLAERLRLQWEVHRALTLDGDADEPSLGLFDPSTEVRLPGYEMLEEIGRGGMGVVYRARQIEPNRLVALKMVLHGPFADARDLRRFRQEAEVIAGLDHPNIVPILEMGHYDRLHYFTMRLVSGGSLADRPGSMRDDPRRVAEVMAVIADAVHHAHRRGVLHRDLKPANILLDEDGRPHVTDFGLAKRTSGTTGLGLTGSGWMMGSPAFMAPEQAAGDPSRITVATDVYGLGAILYALLTGQPPFDGTSPQDVIDRLRNESPRPPSRLYRRVPRPLEHVCMKCLEKDPARRYASARALEEDLRRWLSGRPVSARPVGSFTRAWFWARRHPAQTALAASLALAIGIGFPTALTQWWRAERNLESANHEQRLMRLALVRAEKANSELVAARTRERIERKRAEARFRVALEAIEGFHAQPEDWVVLARDDPDALRRELIQRAEGYYGKLLDSMEADLEPDAQVQLAVAFERIAQFGSDLGSLELALSASDRAIQTRRQVRETEPNEPQRLHQLVNSWVSRGLIARLHDRPDLAQFSFEKGRDLLLGRLAGFPDEEISQDQLSWCLGNIGAVQLMSGRSAEALVTHRRVLAIRNGLIERRPDFASYRLDHAWVLLDLGLTQRALGRLKRSATLMEQAAGELEAALPKASEKAKADGLRRLVECRRELSVTYLKLGKTPEAADQDHKACDDGEQLLRSAPGDVRSLATVANCWKLKTQHQLACNDARGAQVAAQRAVELNKDLVKRRPGALRYREELADCHRLLAHVFDRLGKNEQAVAAAREAVQERRSVSPGPESSRQREVHLANLAQDQAFLAVVLAPSGSLVECRRAIADAEDLLGGLVTPPDDLLYDLGCAHAQFAARQRHENVRPDLVRLGVYRAMNYLHRAVAAGYRDHAWLEKDPDLEIVRSHEGFRTLLQDARFPQRPFAD